MAQQASSFLAHVARATSSTREPAEVAVEVKSVPLSPLLDRLKAASPEYVRLYQKARQIEREEEGGLSDVRKLDAIRRCARPDVAGRPVYVFLPGHVPRGFDLERVLMHAILVMHDEVVNGAPFSAVWVCHNTDEDAQRLSWTWVRYVYRLLPPAYHAGAKAIGLAHPSLGVRAVMLGLSYVLSTPFWDKLVFADRVEFLDEIAKLDVLDLPQAVLDYDKYLDSHAAQVAEQASSAANGTFSGLGVLGLDGGSNRAAGGWDEYAAKLEAERHEGGGGERPFRKEYLRDDEEEESDDEGPIQEVGEEDAEA